MNTRTLVASLAILLGCSAPDATPEPPSAAPVSPPATTATADAAGVNNVLDPAGFSDERVRKAYEAAKQYAHVLESIYCYCKCRENIGHRALVECFETDHAAHCDVCMNEAMITARLTAEGKTPKEIQKAIDALYAG
jgi:hypothetical protein